MTGSSAKVTLLEIATAAAVVATLAAILFVLAIPASLHVRSAANQAQAAGELRGLVAQEAVWRGGDFDGNGRADYWTRDVAALHCGWDAAGRPRALIDRDLALADARPAVDYPELGRPPRRTIPKFSCVDVRPKAGYAYQAMWHDQDGGPYLEGGAPRPAAGNLPKEPSTHSSRFGFTAYGMAGALVFVVNEAGVVWQNDIEESCPIVSWRASYVGTEKLGWSRAGP